MPKGLRFTWFKFWMNAFFTQRRFQGEGPCRFCNKIPPENVISGSDTDVCGNWEGGEEDSLEHLRRCRIISDIGLGLKIYSPQDLTRCGSWYSVYRNRSCLFSLPRWRPCPRGGPPRMEAHAKDREKSLVFFVGALYDVHNNLRVSENFLPSALLGVRKFQALFKEYCWAATRDKKTRRATRHTERARRKCSQPSALAITDHEPDPEWAL